VPDYYNFMTVDLFENKNMAQVVLNINTLKRQLGFGFDKNAPVPEKRMVDSQEPEPTTPKDPTFFSPRSNPQVVDPGSKSTGSGKVAGVAEVTADTGTKKCCVCNLPILSGCISAVGRYYHNKCFTCKKCGVAKLANAKYYEHDHQAYCEKCIMFVAPGGKKVAAPGFELRPKSSGTSVAHDVGEITFLSSLPLPCIC